MTQPQPHPNAVYAPEVWESICERIANGETLGAICSEEGYPCKVRVYKYIKAHPEFEIEYRRARERQVETFVDQLIEIADDGRNDWMEKQGRNGTYIALNDEHIRRSQIRVQVRQWIAERVMARKYGPQARLDVSNPDGSMRPTKLLLAPASEELIKKAAAEGEAGGFAGAVTEDEILDGGNVIDNEEA